MAKNLPSYNGVCSTKHRQADSVGVLISRQGGERGSEEYL